MIDVELIVKVNIVGVIVPPREATDRYGYNHTISCIPIYDADDVVLAETLPALTRPSLIDDAIQEDEHRE